MTSFIGNLFNKELGGMDILFITLNLCGAGFATVWNFRAGKTGILREPRYLVSALAMVYFLAYLVLLFTHVVPTWWSHTLRGLGLITWFYVWVQPARLGIGAQEEIGRRLEQEVLQQIGIHKQTKES